MSRPTGIRVAVARSYASIEQLAAYWRTRMLPLRAWTDRIDALALFDALDESTIRLPDGKAGELTTEVKMLPVEYEAYTLYSSARRRMRLVLSERTYAALEQRDPRAGFTLLHELGHVLMHTSELVRLQSMPHPELVLARQTSSHRHYEDSEWQANAFASAFLMPALGLQEMASVGQITVAALQDHYAVSAQAADYRITNFMSREDMLVELARRGRRMALT